MVTITKDIIIADILEIAPGSVAILEALGMHCLGCPSAASETLGEACEAHGAVVDVVLAQINELIG